MLPDLDLIPGFDVCDKLPGGGAVDVGCNLATGGIGGAVSSMWENMSAELAGATIWMISKFVNGMLAVTDPGVQETWFSAVYDRMRWPAAVIALLILIVGAATSAIRSDGWHSLGRLVAMTAVVSVVIEVSPWAVQGLVAGADVMSAHVASAMQADAVDGLTDVNRALAKTAAGAPGMPAVVSFLLVLLMLVGVAAVGIFMLVRDVGIDVATLLMPILLLGLMHDRLKSITAKAVSALLVLILAKFFFTAVFSLALSGIAHAAGDAASVAGTLLSAGVMFLLAVFVPTMLFRWLPDIDGLSLAPSPRGVGRSSGVSQVSNASHTAIRNAMRNTSHARSSATRMSMRSGTAGKAATAGTTAAGVATAGTAAAAVVAAQGAKKTAKTVTSNAKDAS